MTARAHLEPLRLLLADVEPQAATRRGARARIPRSAAVWFGFGAITRPRATRTGTRYAPKFAPLGPLRTRDVVLSGGTRYGFRYEVPKLLRQLVPGRQGLRGLRAGSHPLRERKPLLDGVDSMAAISEGAARGCQLVAGLYAPGNLGNTPHGMSENEQVALIPGCILKRASSSALIGPARCRHLGRSRLTAARGRYEDPGRGRRNEAK